jgi:hypothetical protein
LANCLKWLGFVLFWDVKTKLEREHIYSVFQSKRKIQCFSKTATEENTIIDHTNRELK